MNGDLRKIVGKLLHVRLHLIGGFVAPWQTEANHARDVRVATVAAALLIPRNICVTNLAHWRSVATQVLGEILVSISCGWRLACSTGDL